MSKRRDWDKARRQSKVGPTEFLRKNDPPWVVKAVVKVFVWGAHRAEWRRHNGTWGCWKADDGLLWMIGISATPTPRLLPP